MRVFTHGSNVNFQESAREMLLPDLSRLVDYFTKEHSACLVGTISLEQEEIRLLGSLESLKINTVDENWQMDYLLHESKERERFSLPLEQLVQSHEAVFDIVEEEKPLRYQALYFTFQGDSQEEQTYFIAPIEIVAEPLAYMAEFWRVTQHVGREIDFSISGCSAFDLNRKLRAER